MGTLSRLTKALDKLSRAGRLRQNGGGRMPIYLTEFGYFSSGHRAVEKNLRVKWLKQAYSIALANGRVKSQLQYLLVAPPRALELGVLQPRADDDPGQEVPDLQRAAELVSARIAARSSGRAAPSTCRTFPSRQSPSPRGP